VKIRAGYVEATWEKIRIQSYRRAMVRGSGELLRPDRGRELRDASGCPLRDVSDGPRGRDILPGMSTHDLRLGRQ
jgi:hypothetical protein